MSDLGSWENWRISIAASTSGGIVHTVFVSLERACFQQLEEGKGG